MPSFLLEGVHFSLDAERMRITLAWLQNRNTGRGVWESIRGSSRLLTALRDIAWADRRWARGFPVPGKRPGAKATPVGFRFLLAALKPLTVLQIRDVLQIAGCSRFLGGLCPDQRMVPMMSRFPVGHHAT